MRPVRIAIIRLGSLGDILHTLPALSALRRKFPRDEGEPSSRNRIEWLVESAHAPFLAGHPMLDDLHVMDTQRWRRLRRGAAGPVDAVRRVRRSRFDVALDFQGLLKSAILARLSGAKKRIGFGSGHCREPAASAFYTHPVAPPIEAEHVIEQNLSLLEPLGIDGDVPIEFPLALTESDRRPADAFFADRGWTSEVPVVAICPGAGWETKRWGVERFAALGDRIAGECIEEQPFHRGDANADGSVDISDPSRVFAFLFLGATPPTCLDSADANDDGNIDITDGVFLLRYLFNGAGQPPAPGPPGSECGNDPANGGDSLSCVSYDSC